MSDTPAEQFAESVRPGRLPNNLDLMYRQLVREWRKMADELAEALKECWLDVSNGTDDSAHLVDAALARYAALNDGEA